MMIDDDGIVLAFAVRVFRALQKDGNLTLWPFGVPSAGRCSQHMVESVSHVRFDCKNVASKVPGKIRERAGDLVVRVFCKFQDEVCSVGSKPSFKFRDDVS